MPSSTVPLPRVAGLTPHQRFFISWATARLRNYTDEHLRLLVNCDPHSPSELRCSGPLSDMSSSASAFGIPNDHRTMRLVDQRVDIW